MGRPVVNHQWHRYGRLLALAHVASDLRKQAIWLCQCDCGKECLVRGQGLSSGATTSCGCYRNQVRRLRPLVSSQDRFWPKVEIPCDPDDCWHWIGAADEDGYGRFGVGRRDGKTILAHRYSFELFYGSAPAGLDVCHACNNPRCVNFSHLYAGTRLQNMQQAQRQGRLKQPFRPWTAARHAAHETRKRAA